MYLDWQHECIAYRRASGGGGGCCTHITSFMSVYRVRLAVRVNIVQILQLYKLNVENTNNQTIFIVYNTHVHIFRATLCPCNCCMGIWRYRLAPEYLCNMVELYAPDRVLRSASKNLLVVPRGKHCQYGMRTFAMAAATLWNSLNVRDRGNRIRGSPSLESFKSNLKTLLFKEHFYPFSS